MLDGILSNPTIQKLAFGQLKGLFSEKNLDFILVKLDDQGEIELEMHKVGESRIIPALIVSDTVDSPTAIPVRPERLRLTKKKGGKHA